MESSRPRSVRPPSGVASKLCCLLLTALCLLSVGCNQGKQLQRDLVQRELRLQEDEIYRLEDYLEEYQRKVCHLRAENQQLQRRLNGAAGGDSSATIPPADAGEDLGSRLDPPIDPTPADSEPFDEDAPELPVIDFGTPVEAPPARPSEPPSESPSEPPPFVPSAPPTGDEAPPFNSSAPAGSAAPPFVPEEIAAPSSPVRPTGFDDPPPGGAATVEEATAFESAPVDAPRGVDQPSVLTRVSDARPLLSPPPSAAAPPARVRIESRCGPDEPTGQPTLLVLATPVDERGKPMTFAGEASVMLRDAAADAGRRRLARWDFTSHEVIDATALSGDSSAIELLIGLPDKLPAERSIELWVRLVDEQGRKTLGKAAFRLHAEVDPVSAASTSKQGPEAVTNTGWSNGEKRTSSSGPIEVDLPPPSPAPRLRPPASEEASWAPTPANGASAARGVRQKPLTEQHSTIRLVTHNAPLAAPQSLPAAPISTRRQRKSRDAVASRPVEDSAVMSSP